MYKSVIALFVVGLTACLPHAHDTPKGKEKGEGKAAMWV